MIINIFGIKNLHWKSGSPENVLKVFGAREVFAVQAELRCGLESQKKVEANWNAEMGFKCCRGMSQRDFLEVVVCRLYLCQKNPIVFLDDVASWGHTLES